MLFHLLFIMSLVGQGLSVESFGKDFITAFPENVASYHPQASSNMLQITAFYTDTTVSITFNRTNVYNENLQSGQTRVVHFPTYVEQYQFKRSFYSVRINSSKLIVVLWISQRGDSVQSSFVQPVKNLGKQYSIPFINYNQMLASLYSRALDNWRCIIINAGSIMNTISIQTVSMNAQQTFNFTLRPHELYQFQTNGSEIKVYSNNTVAVLLTHPCAETSWCVCNMVTNHVLPENLWGQTFVVPSVKNLNSTWLQVTSTTNLTLTAQNIKIAASNSDLISFPYLESGPQLITASNNVSIRLISPGFILELMPESMFAACFLLQVNSTGAEVLIIAETASRGDVYVDAGLLSSTDWKTVANSRYSSVSVSLRGTHVIWHPASRIGVYMFEKMESGIPYGGPAVILNEDPDRDGCMADPALYKTTTDVMTWPESHDYCLNATLQLSKASSARAQRDMTNFLQKDVGPRYFWIGLRRSLLTLEWYWKNGNNSEYSMNYTKWADGHQETPWKSLCASVSQDANKDFSWKSVPCCSKMRPVCYKKALYFSGLTFDSLHNHFYIVNQTVCLLNQCHLF
ncbi:IgGFc-binding protein-like [Pimephales promelas]|uniref:IgGFc-binding protein-like n=1 Tax=Pimephales promelas TaxID=90988 RepID=UPI001955B21D|nr:IgGFc-binding protein-like [Pimephales promelas]